MTLLDEVHTKILRMREPTPATGTAQSTALSISDQDVYFRFGGGILASMLHNRYKEIRRCNKDKRDFLSMEIKLLQTINTKEKTHMPNYLQYRDKGHMYTPDATFIPFFRSVDECIKSVVNENGIQNHGDQLIKVSNVICAFHHFILYLHRLHMQLCLKPLISKRNSWNCLCKRLLLTLMWRKLCNTRIQEFLSSLTQKITSSKGKVATTGQNLRDQLLTQHINVQSRVI